jgi:uncharacterized protein (UPF0332 family)
MAGSVRQLVLRYLEEGERALKSAERLSKEGDARGAINRAYYACFYVASAALACKYISAKKHAGVVEEFWKRIVKQGLLPKKTASILRELYSLREASDYQLHKKFPGKTIDKALNDATDFCTTVAEWCRGQMDKLL